MRIPNAGSLTDKEVRMIFNLPDFTKMKNPTDLVGKDEVVANIYQLACGLTNHNAVDYFTCAS